jgi:polyhydroxyalkanoate synthase
MKQSYLLVSRNVQGSVHGARGVDLHTQHQAEFYTRQFLNAFSPTNFAATNPVVLKTTIASRGENLIKGLRNLIEDIERGGGRLSLKMSDLSAFQFGKNIAISPGKVVFQNKLMQLIQYAPSTQTVHRRPLLIVPPWINKFYILDLKPKNSFIKWCTDQGHTVFVISWVNPGAELAGKGFADYLLEGPLEALEAIKRATGEEKANVVGYCIGGTLAASALAYMAATGDRRIVSATLFTTLLDFADVGDISVFLDDAQLQLADEHMNRLGYLEGHHMAEAFNLLRENDLIWFFFVNNYLMGREPSAFDLLYWNSDSTRMPATMHSFYLRNMYYKNVLKDPGGINLANVAIDLRKIEVPVYFLSTREDHIAPWRSTYAGARLVSGPVRFVLGASGHVAGVINPPSANKYGYWTGKMLPADPESWLNGGKFHQGSWWTDWAGWIADYGGGQVPAREPGSGELAAIEDAPGSYVKVRAV